MPASRHQEDTCSFSGRLHSGARSGRWHSSSENTTGRGVGFAGASGGRWMAVLACWALAGCAEPAAEAPETPTERGSAYSVPRAESASRWPEFLGPTRDGRAAQEPEMDKAASVELELLWRRPLGPGYSGIVVDGGRVFTLFSDGTSDVLMGMSAATGDELWRHVLAPTLEDNGGAEEGPLSTPAVLGDAVYALGPRGQLVAVGVRDGELLWERDVVRELGAGIPEFHLTTSPMIFGDLLVVQVASRRRGFVCGLDRSSGETRWCTGRGGAGYQSPARLNLGDGQVVVAVSNSHLMGLEPDSGVQRWTYKYDRRGEEGASHPILAGERRILIQGSDGFALFELSLESEVLQVEKVWENEMFHHNFDVPLYHEGYLYSFGGKLLTCLNVHTGRSVWRSKKTGGGNAILVGPFLAVWSPGGTIRMVRATPEGYNEVASLKLLDEGSYTAPSYADGTLFVRNLQEIAAARVLPLQDEHLSARQEEFR
ncbi:MAG: hypothetical protein E2P04_05445 [Acidobacteria bacterium]|nr:MAG: hypothetical protein E2P04_05445 [Acidobacteriota bacterium]